MATPPTTPPLRWLAQFAVVALTAFIVVRTFGVEPYGVPTGSMAPALWGDHREVPCPRCGGRVVVGDSTRPGQFDAVPCPNCGHATSLVGVGVIAGDRLIVDKTAYQFRDPRRWEVVVFRCPADGDKPYIKRAVGLPGERMTLKGGDVYADGKLVRKSLAQVRQTLVPLFEYDRAPPPDKTGKGGWGPRFWAQSPAGLPSLAPAGVVAPDGLHLDAANHADGLAVTYRHVDLDTNQEVPARDGLSYNGPPGRRGFAALPDGGPGGVAVHDFCARFEVESGSAPGVLACRLFDGGASARLEIPLGGAGQLTLAEDGGAGRAATAHPGARPGRPLAVEFALVDRRATVAVGGAELLTLDLPEPPRPRGPVSRPAQWGVTTGTSATLRRLELLRDIHYLPHGAVAREWTLGPGEYFVLGDNSADSHDSRAWQIAGVDAPGVPTRVLIGKPVVLHQPLRPAGWLGAPGSARAPDFERLRLLR